MRQEIRYTTTGDGARLAWAAAGEGTPLVKASNWLTHLEYDLDSPVWRHWIRFLAGHFRLIRYDERGCGMSDRKIADSDCGHWLPDFEAVIRASEPVTPFVLLGISQGGVAAIQYAIRHPENVSQLVLYGAYARGWARRGSADDEQRFRAANELTRLGWGQDNPVYRQLFTARFIPEGTAEQFDWFNELCRRTTTPEIAYRLIEARGKVDIVELLQKVSVPTLVIHGRRDEVVPFEEGVSIASRIPDARFVELDSRNHILLEHEPAWERFREAVIDFTGSAAGADDEDPIFSSLTKREREILVEIAKGATNQEAGNRLFISEKTVRNHLTRIFEKLGVHSRAQAIVAARDGHLDLDDR
ncbi:MAG: alpha/beta fold hydrolase [Woeseiaceae bacterium]|nr:alpha/beta fold hydrolase [Woeseiaceae bacterium]